MTRMSRRSVGLAVALALLAGGCGSNSVSTVPQASQSAAPSAVQSGPASTPASQATAAPVQMSPLPAGAIKVVTLGDSLTEGQGDDSGKGGYPGRLATLIEQSRPGSTVANFGHSGWSSTDVIAGHDSDPSELTQALAVNADIALIWIGSNDLWYLYEFGPDPMTGAAEQADLDSFQTNVDTLIEELTSRGVRVFIALLDDQSKRPVAANPPNPAEPAFPNTTKAELALMSAHIDAYNTVIRWQAAKYGAGVVDFHSTTIFTTPALLYGDGNHPNEAGYDQVAQIWYQALRSLLG